ncbi:hypothetical protein D3C75_922270 [compost metagenome]
MAEVLLCQGFDPFRCNIANNYQRRIVRRIPGLIPLLQLRGVHALQIVHPADRRGAVAAGRVSDAVQSFVSRHGDFIINAHPTLLLNDLELRCEVLFIQLGRTHQVGQYFERDASAAGRQGLVKNCVVSAGGCVMTGAKLIQYRHELSGAGLAAAFVDHMFEGVGQARLAGWFVA